MLQGPRLVLGALSSLGDTPPHGLQPPLVDGVHLRWSFPRDVGFPWYGYYLFRRPSGDKARERCVLRRLGSLDAGGLGTSTLPTPLGTFSSDAELVVTDDFPAAGVGELDLAGRRQLRFDLAPGAVAHRVRVTIGCRDQRPDEWTCVRWTREDAGQHPNPYNGGGASFEVRDHNGALRPDIKVRTTPTTLGDAVGLDCGFLLTATLPVAATAVRMRLVQYARPAEIRALDASGGTLTQTVTTAPQRQPENVVLTGPGIASVEVVAQSDETFLFELCWTTGDLRHAPRHTGNPRAVPKEGDGAELTRPASKPRPRGCRIPVTAHYLGGAVGTTVAHVLPGQVGEVVLVADAITSVTVGTGEAALVDVCFTPVAADATSGWEPVPKCPEPLCLPVRHADYPCHAGPHDAGADAAEAIARIRYGDPNDYQGTPFAELREQLLALVTGGPTGGAMADRAATDVQGVPTTADPARQPTMARQRPLDLVLLGSLHPPIAQMVGLFWVDETAKVGSVYDYLVVADHTGVARGTAAGMLVEIGANGFANVDAWISYGVTHGANPPLTPPWSVRAYALPGLVTDSAGGASVDASNNAGLRWPVPTGFPVTDRAVLFHVWRERLGNAVTPATPSGGDVVTKAAPVLAVDAAAPGGSDWPPFSLQYVDRALAEGWYAYQVSGIDLFGRHSAPSAAAPWHQWKPVPHPRPWYYTSPPSDAQVHPSAVRLLDKVPPPPPTGVEAHALDPGNPLLVRDAAHEAWWATLSTAEQASVIGLRVRWRWTASHMRQAPDTGEFRVYVNPASEPPTGHDRATSWQQRVFVVGYAEHVTVTTDAASDPLRLYEVFLPVAGDPVRTGIDLPVTAADPIAYATVGVTAVDNRPHTADDPKWGGTRWGGRPGNEGRVGPPSVVYRVRRVRPDPPVVPADSERVFATPADYYGHSYYTYRWRPVTGLLAHVFRALDDMVFQVDWEYRQHSGQRTAIAASDTQLFPAESAEPRWDATKRAQVAAELNALRSFTPAATMPAPTRTAYQGLSNDALRVLAGLPGLERAFAQITSTPLDPAAAENTNRVGPDNPPGFVVDPALRAYVDTLDGASTNRYFYRVAYVDAVNNRSQLSLSSPPVWLPNVVPPRPPALARAEGGDRAVTLRWASNREAELSAYRVYRAGDERAAADVRTMAQVHLEAVAAGDPAARPAQVAWIDSPVPGRVPLWYRLVAVDSSGKASRPTEAVLVRAFDASRPAHPAWNSTSTDASGATVLAWTSPDPTLRCLVQRRGHPAGQWTPVSSWLPRGTYTFTDTTRAPGLTYDYRLRVMNANGTTNDSHTELTS
jgi:hypothetical protein